MSPADSVKSASMLRSVTSGFRQTAADIVPWFYDNMPEYYFRTHTPEEQLRHLYAIVSQRLSGEKDSVTLKSHDGHLVTYLTPGDWMEALLEIVEEFRATPLAVARIICSRDGSLRLSDLFLDPQPRAQVQGKAFRKALAAMKAHVRAEERKEFRQFLAQAPWDYVEKFDPERALRHFQAHQRIRGSDEVEVGLEKDLRPGEDRVTLNMTSPPHYGLLSQLLRIFVRHGAVIDRAYGDVFEAGSEKTLFMSFYLRGETNPLRQPGVWQQVERELAGSKWRPALELDRLTADHGWSPRRVELMEALCALAHQLLGRKDRNLYTHENIRRAVVRHQECAASLVDMFEARFDPALAARERAVRQATTACEARVAEAPDQWQELFATLRRCCEQTLRCNYYLPRRFGLAFRLDPAILDEPIAGEIPYGIYFFHGPHCLGFHVRFREMSRGGLRIVPTRTQSRFETEELRVFDECAALARTQQDKNKDIPEGGAKAVLLVGPEGNADLALKSLVDGMLDLILVSPQGPTLPGVVDYLGRPEVIYFGPDENITEAHIEWMVARASLRGYPWPSAFMSSKPRIGMNHKVYGVTSLGVLVYVEEFLRHLGIDPRQQPFSVKLTGGPRGDVAGNAVKFMIQRYGANARILAMSDSRGAAYDPQGLDHDELLRLVAADKQIHEFAAARLSGPEAFVLRAETPADMKRRDSLHNTVVADVFIPAGGRPDTINDHNWREYLRPDGHPSSRIIVEGANIFISPKAREQLEDAGALVVQGSSANKTGVICSSYEILAGLSLSDEEILAIHGTYARQVLAILEQRALSEARLLLREYQLAGGSRRLSAISRDIAREINGLADQIAAFLNRQDLAYIHAPGWKELLLAYLPPVLATRYPERVMAKVPFAHQVALLAHFVAARMVYGEGLGWLRTLTGRRTIEEVVLAYLAQEQQLHGLLEQLRTSRLPQRRQLATLVEATGRTYLTMQELGLR